MPEDTYLEAQPKPRWRGRLHQIAFIVSIPAGLILVALAERPVARATAAVYALCLIGMYGSSASYHLGQWSGKALRWMRRLDHSMIYLLIAGSYTPIALISVGGKLGIATLVIVWAGAVGGITMKLVRVDGFRILSNGLYIVLGWTMVIAAPQLIKGLTPMQLILILSGGLLYTGGSIILALHKPNPSPAVFGYHEIWHSMVVAAGVCHYIAILTVARTPA
jgi:hemolysin III